MNIDEAFTLWYSKQDNHGLPWQTPRDELFNVFYAGWHAHAESLKQTDLFPGHLSDDICKASLAQLVEHPPCKRKVIGSTPIAGSKITKTKKEAMLASGEITPELIYACYPRKVGKNAAIKAIIKAEREVRDGDHGGWDYLLKQTRAYADAVATWPAADKQYIPHPATWYNRGSYDDDPKEWQRGAEQTSQFSKKHT